MSGPRVPWGRRAGAAWLLAAACVTRPAPVEAPLGPPPEAVAPSAAPAPRGADTARAQALGRQIRCPVCQGMPINESPATMAQDMQAKVNQLVAEGQDDDHIRQYFIDRYGAWVLLDPPPRGVTLWLWVLPWAFLAVAVAMAQGVWRRARGPRRAGPPAVPGAPAGAWGADAGAGGADADAELLARIRREAEP